MAKFKFFGANEADAEIRGADGVIDPLLVASKITTIEVNGEQVPATSEKVPLKLKIAAFAATFKAGAGDAELSQMIANNTILADQAKVLQARAVTAETNAATATREKIAADERIVVLTGSVEKLTSENAELITLRKAANTEAGRVTGELNAINTEISKKALAWNAITDLRDEKGNVLSSKATDAEKLSAAERIPVAEKLTAIGGAVTAALQRAGVRAEASPAQAPAGTTGSAPTMKREEFLKLEAKDQTAFLAAKGKLTD